MTNPDGIPPPDRPVTQAAYGIPSDDAGLLDWETVRSLLADDRAYWVTTVTPDGRPHARPTWGVWLDDTLYCGGGERTRWVRNLAATPAVTVHRCDADDVVIVEGVAERLDADTATPSHLDRVDAAYEAKYGVPHGTPVFAIRPRAVYAWTDFPADATRWRFAAPAETRER